MVLRSLIILGALSMTSVQAGETNLILHSVSKHIGTDRQHNEYNPAIGLELIDGKHGFTVGMYRDSYSTTARYIGGLYLPYQSSHTKLGLMYGAVLSPSYNEGNILPMVLPYASFNYSRLGVNVMYLPKFQKGGAHTIGIQFKLMLGD